jgi:hypothetical protein
MKLFNAQSDRLASNVSVRSSINLEQKVLPAEFYVLVSGGMMPFVPPLHPKPKETETETKQS